MDAVAVTTGPVGGGKPPLAERGGGLRPLPDRPEPWNAALAEAGAAVGFRRWSDEAIRLALAAYWTRSGRPPTAEDFRTSEWRGPTASTLRRRYGSVERAWQALGPVPA